MPTLSQGIDRIQSRSRQAERRVIPPAPLQLARRIVRMPVQNGDKFVAPLTLGDRIIQLAQNGAVEQTIRWPNP